MKIDHDPAFRCDLALRDHCQAAIFHCAFSVRNTANNVDALGLSAADAYAVNRGNAEKLFPRFKS